MIILSCPFCGPRGEGEFHFGGDFGNARPEGFEQVSADQWSRYLHHRRNPKGSASEIWMHLTCGEIFRVDRDTVSHAVASTSALAAEASE